MSDVKTYPADASIAEASGLNQQETRSDVPAVCCRPRRVLASAG